ncbi:unnamed protein product [Rotaria sordida]|uniref:Transmembrane protein 186 n=1 Tax=Rotaria sordida TaxID=392033 RepID=A0A819CPU2_9BILA|nr:unnamed protein product [Rotaria sordida]
MKIMSKTTGNNNNRISALKRLSSKSSPINNNINRRQLIGTKNSLVQDARELLINRNQSSSSSFDARQLLSRQSSKTLTNTIVRKNLLQNKQEIDNNNGKMVVVTGLKDMKMKDGRLIPTATTSSIEIEKKKKIFAVGPSTFVTIRNNSNSNSNSTQSTEKFSFTKTITNPSVRIENDIRSSQTTTTLSSLSDQKVVISFVNDQYQKIPKPSQPIISSSSSSPSPSIQQHHPPPMIKRLHDASIQTTSSSSSRSPIRMSSHRRHTSTTIDDEDRISYQSINDDLYEPPVKRTASSTRKTTTTTTTADKEQQGLSTVASTGSVKRTSTGVPISSRITSNTSTVSKPISTTQSISIPGTILVTNLQPSVTEEDVIELFSEIGRINEITTLSQGCVQIIYTKREHAEQAVTKYHNRLLDGQFMYVSLQQSSSYPKITNNIQQSAKENGTSISSSSITTDQPLKLNSTNNTTNKITIDPAFIRQALFHPSNNTTNPVQFQTRMFIRNIQIFRLIYKQNLYRFFSTTNICFDFKQEQNQILNKKLQNDILPIENNLPSLANLPSYLPEPTGVKSKLFNDFYLIYRFGFLRSMRYIQILKLSQTLATVLLAPYQIYNYNEGLITLFELQFSLFLVSLASFSLYLFGWLATRTICYIYTNVECDRVILTHVDFWGRRKNIELNTRDIIPINDIETPNKTFLPFKRYSTINTMYYSIQFGKILDRPRFNRIFAGIITQDMKNWW